MRTIVFFDLPVVKVKQRREYQKFIKFLKKTGFYMMEESVYVKLCINQAAVDSTEALLESNKPDEGIVAVLTITEKQFSSIKFIVGKLSTEVLNTDERYLEL